MFVMQKIEKCFVASLAIAVLALSKIYPGLYAIVFFFGLALIIRLIWLHRTQQVLAVFWTFNLTYVALLMPYFVYHEDITAKLEFQNPMSMDKTLFIHVLWILSIYIFTPPSKIKRGECHRFLALNISTPVFVAISTIMLAAIAYIAVKLQNIYSGSGSAWSLYVENIDNGTGLPEYFCIGLGLMALSATTGKRMFVMLTVFFAFGIVAFDRGLRISLLMAALVLFATTVQNRFRTWTVLLTCTAGFFIFHAIGEYRNGARTFGELMSFHRGNYLNTNQTEVFYTSNMVIASVDDGAVRGDQRAISALNAVVQTLLPPRLVDTNAGKPALYLLELTGRAAGGGNLISTCAYFWGSYPGVILFGFFIAWLSQQLYSGRNLLIVAGALMVFSLYPRWVAYDTVNYLFRLPIYFAFCYWLLSGGLNGRQNGTNAPYRTRSAAKGCT